MKLRKKIKQGIAYALSTVMVVGMFTITPNGIAEVLADESDSSVKTIAGLSTSNIADPIIPVNNCDAWKGSYVYFGTYNGNPVKYRVLDSDTIVFSEGSNNKTMLLDCDSILWAGDNPSSAFDTDDNIWANSDIRAYLNGTFFTDNFNTIEQNAIAESTKSSAHSTDGIGSNEYAPLAGDKIFLLDIVEAENTSYGYIDSYNFTGYTWKVGASDCWWLRSPAGPTGGLYADFFHLQDGGLWMDKVSSTLVGVSPALNVNLSSILFSSVISGTVGETGAEYKLTLLDSNMSIECNGDATRSGDIITIPYTISGMNSANATQVSVLLLDKEYIAGNTNNADILFYGALNDNDSFTLPVELSDKVWGSDYYAYIIAEDVNGEKVTDYASTPVEITEIYNEVSDIDIEIETPIANSALDTSVIVSSGIEVTAVTWMDGESAVTGNAGYNTAYTVKVTFIARDGNIFTDNMDVTLNGNAVNGLKNTDGTITVSYTFPVTEMRTITYTATGYEGTYDGEAHSITVDVTEPEGATITYSLDTGDNKTYSATKPTFTDVGTYTVYYKVEKTDYTTVKGSKIVKINKKAVNVTAEDQTIIYGNNIDDSKYTVTGLLVGDSFEGVSLTPSTKDATDNGSIAVSYEKIVNEAGVDVTANYDVTYTVGSLVIEERTTNNSNAAGNTSSIGGNDSSSTTPGTGDITSIYLWILLLIGGGFAIVCSKKESLCKVKN